MASITTMARPDLKSEPWLNLANTIRARGQAVNPWRLGLEAGRAGMNVAPPYQMQRSADQFRSGVYSARMALEKSAG